MSLFLVTNYERPYERLLLHYPPNSRRPYSNPTDPRFRQALVGKMLPKPFIVVKISDCDRVLLDIIKLIMPSMGGGGCK